MTTSRKQKKLAIQQCKSVEKLAEAVQKINGVDMGFTQQLLEVRSKMQIACSSIFEDDAEITEEIAICLSEQEQEREQEQDQQKAE